MKEFLRRTIKAILKILALIVYRPKVVGRENIPKEESAIICPNHVHALDSAIILLMNKRPIRVLAKESLYENFMLRWLAHIFGIYPVKLNNKSLETMKISLQLLKNNELLLIFPEGTRNGMAKGVEPKPGAIKLAARTGVPIIPLGVQGNFKAFRRLKLNIGKPIYYYLTKEELNEKEKMRVETAKLMNEIVKLRDS